MTSVANLSRQLPRRARRAASAFALTCGLAASFGACAAPLPANVDRQIQVFAPATECMVTSITDRIVCASTTGATLGFAGTGSWGEQIIASATVGADNLQVHLQGITHADVAAPIMDVVQFDNITVSGPSPTVQVGVHAHIVGSAAPSNGNFASGTWTFALGARNPSPAPDYLHFGDWVVIPGRVLQDNGQMWSTIVGAVHPSVDDTIGSTMTVNTGQPFELGAELTIMELNLNVSFSHVQWSFDVPAGYQLTSSRGLAVPSVPEPGGAATLLAGVAALGFVVLRRQGGAPAPGS